MSNASGLLKKLFNLCKKREAEMCGPALRKADRVPKENPRYSQKSKLQLTNNFFLCEFFISAIHPALARIMRINKAQKDLFAILCILILQPVRNIFGTVIILSGFRSPELNTAVDGSDNSDHMRALAVDFYCPDADMEEIWRYLKDIFDGVIGQCILYKKSNFIHASLVSINHQGEFFEL